MRRSMHGIVDSLSDLEKNTYEVISMNEVSNSSARNTRAKDINALPMGGID